MILGYIIVNNLYSKVEKLKGGYIRTTRMGPGSRKIREAVSDLEAAKPCAYPDWKVNERLLEAKNSRHPFQRLLTEIDSI